MGGKQSKNRDSETAAPVPAVSLPPINDTPPQNAKWWLEEDDDDRDDVKEASSIIFCPKLAPSIDMKHDHPEIGWGLCDIAHRARFEYSFDEEVYEHLSQFAHSHDRIPCRFGRSCRAFIRMHQNESYRCDDRCHLLMFSHPPRNRMVKMPPDYHPMTYRTQDRNVWAGCREKIVQTWGVSCNTFDSDMLVFLICEIIENGFGADLILEKSDSMKKKLKGLETFKTVMLKKMKRMTESELKQYLEESPQPHVMLSDLSSDECGGTSVEIMAIVHEKFAHERYQMMVREKKWYEKVLSYGEMLSIILYSGCDCNYDLCREQRMLTDDGNVTSSKWSVFEWCLCNAIERLHYNDKWFHCHRPRFVYSGIGKVLLTNDMVASMSGPDEHVGKKCKFSSFVSTSRSLLVATEFRGNDGGLLFRIDLATNMRRLFHCDISWISKFPDEQEVLFSFGWTRGVSDNWRLNNFLMLRQEESEDDENSTPSFVQYFDVTKW